MDNIIRYTFRNGLLGMLCLTVVSSAYASELEGGKELFEQVCASCHSKDLSGATGFNLKDGEWIHGSKPSQIMNNIKNGFANAGMPSFGAVYTDPQLQSIVAYILSKREGFDGLTYKLYQMTDSQDKDIDDSKLIKQGELPSNFADFQLPEIEHYFIEFEGSFYAPKDQDSRVGIRGKRLDANVFINGKRLKRQSVNNPTWKLVRGKQHLKITYHSGNNKIHKRNLSLIVTNDELSIKLFPISVAARKIMAEEKVVVKAINKTVIQRKKMMKVPAYSILVGLPAKINYAFNTRLCSIVALWQGDMLDVGPNVSGRGQDGSLPLGDWVFHQPKAVQQISASKNKCQYKGYKIENNEPIFSYQLGDIDYKLMAMANSDSEIQFHYQTESKLAVKFSLPQANKLTWSSTDGHVNNSNAMLSPNEHGNFTISAKIN